MAPYYPLVLTLHSWLRLAAFVLCVVVFLDSLSGWLRQRPMGIGSRRLVLGLTIAVDLQLVLGLLLYLVFSPQTQQALQDFGAAMKDDERRRWAVEHPTMMIAAIALWHAASVIGKRTPADSVRQRWNAIASGVMLLLLIVGSPWPWSATARDLVRLGG